MLSELIPNFGKPMQVTGPDFIMLGEQEGHAPNTALACRPGAGRAAQHAQHAGQQRAPMPLLPLPPASSCELAALRCLTAVLPSSCCPPNPRPPPSHPHPGMLAVMAAFKIMPLRLALSGFSSTGLITVTVMFVGALCWIAPPCGALHEVCCACYAMLGLPLHYTCKASSTELHGSLTTPSGYLPLLAVAQGITSTGGMDWLVTKVGR